MTKKKNQGLESKHSPSRKSFEEFCRAGIEDRIVNKQELIRLTTLSTLRKLEKTEETSEIQCAILKQKLLKPYPSLQLIMPTKFNASALVCEEENKVIFLVSYCRFYSALSQEDTKLNFENEYES